MNNGSPFLMSLNVQHEIVDLKKISELNLGIPKNINELQ